MTPLQLYSKLCAAPDDRARMRLIVEAIDALERRIDRAAGRIVDDAQRDKELRDGLDAIDRKHGLDPDERRPTD